MGTYERDAFVKTEKSVGPCTMKGTLMKFITTAMPARPALSPERLLRDHWLDRRRWQRSRWRERKCHPGIPAVGPVFGGELPVAKPICRPVAAMCDWN